MPPSSLNPGPFNHAELAERLRFRKIRDECRIALFHLTEAERTATTKDLFFDDIHVAMRTIAGIIDDVLDRCPESESPPGET